MSERTKRASRSDRAAVGKKKKRRSRIVKAPGSSSSGNMPFVAAGAAILVLAGVGLSIGMSGGPAPASPARSAPGESTSSSRAAPGPAVAAPTSESRAAADQRRAQARSTPNRSRSRAPSVPRFSVGENASRPGERRYLKVTCGSCNAKLEAKTEACPSCSAPLRWPERITCLFCAKELPFKVAEGDSTAGFCGICKGTGKNPRADLGGRLPFGMSRDRDGGTGEDCPACRGSGRCQFCKGTGSMEVPQYFSK